MNLVFYRDGEHVTAWNGPDKLIPIYPHSHVRLGFDKPEIPVCLEMVEWCKLYPNDVSWDYELIGFEWFFTFYFRHSDAPLMFSLAFSEYLNKA